MDSAEHVSVFTELIELSINYAGTDYVVCVPAETATILVNDPDAATKYVEEHCLSDVCTVHELDLSETESETNACPSTSSNNESSCSSTPLIWSSKSKQTEEDHNATLLLLQLRKKFANKFDDKKTSKSSLWHKIADEIQGQGFKIGEGGTEKCRQKFANMQKQYLKHIRHMKTTGTKKKNPPPYFEEVHGILGNKDKVDPTNLKDSLDMNDSVGNILTNDSAATSSESASSSEEKIAICNRFKATRTSTTPKSSNALLLEYCKEENEVDRADRDRHFASIEKLLETQNKQRDKMLELLGELVTQNRKRPHDDN